MLLAEHLAVLGSGFAALMPWLDVVGLHIGQLVSPVFAARAFALLPLVGFTFLAIRKLPYVEVSLLTGQPPSSFCASG